MDRSSIEKPEGAPVVTNLEQQLRDLFQERSESARPDPDLHAVMTSASRVTFTAHEKTPSRQRRIILQAAAVTVAGVAASVIGYAIRPTSHPPIAPVTYPAVIPPAPMASEAQMSAIEPHFYALTVDGTSLRLDTGTRHDPLVGADPAAGVDSPWNRWTSASGSIIDSDGTSPGGFYIVTCCTPGGVIWRNGVREAAGTHMDYLVLDSTAERVLLDPATSSVIKGLGDPATNIVEPGAIDVALLDHHTMGILVGGTAPKLVITNPSAASRRVIPLQSGPVEPCAVVALQSRFVVLLGAPKGNDPCVGDRALLVDSSTGHIAATLRMPAEVRGMNSNHAEKVIAVTVQGNVVLGDFTTTPSWITLLKGRYLSAGLW
jgi:hypothetical protein